MPLETGTYISDLVATNPAHSDPLSQVDAHLRLIKAALLATFPSINAALSITDEQLNALAVSMAGGAAISALNVGALGANSISVVNDLVVGGKIAGNGGCPTGLLGDFLQTSIPTGWYEANGQAVSRTGATAALFALYGTTYGAGDGSTTFNLPNLNDYFRRSRGTNAVGVFQAESIKDHTHSGTTSGANGVGVSISDPGHVHNGVKNATGAGIISGSASASSNPQYGNFSADIGTASATTGISASVNVPGLGFSTSSMAGAGSETRPKSIVVVTCVKA